MKLEESTAEPVYGRGPCQESAALLVMAPRKPANSRWPFPEEFSLLSVRTEFVNNWK
jgi:hypothetical protein